MFHSIILVLSIPAVSIIRISGNGSVQINALGPILVRSHPINFSLNPDISVSKMSNDASLPPNAPIINGLDTQPQIDGEEDASPLSATIPASTSSLEAVSQDMNRRVTAFLNRRPDSDLVRRVQEQTRISIAVIEKALTDYECVQTLPDFLDIDDM